jgi:hypothetical protein
MGSRLTHPDQPYKPKPVRRPFRHSALEAKAELPLPPITELPADVFDAIDPDLKRRFVEGKWEEDGPTQ